MASSKAKVTLKLLIYTKSKRVLLAEVGKDFVDFQFNLLCLPVGTVVRLLTTQTIVGMLGNLYKSIENLNETYFQPDTTKLSLLNPKPPTGSSDVNPLFLLNDISSNIAKKFFMCPNIFNTRTYQSHMYVSNVRDATCPNCNNRTSKEMAYVTQEGMKEVKLEAGEGGFVKGVVTYMVSLKLRVDTNGKRVLFTEPGKDFVDFLFDLLHLPVGAVVKLLKKQAMAPIGSSDISPLLLLDEVSDGVEKRFYVCNNSCDCEDDQYYHYHPYVSNDSEALCPDCNSGMSREVGYVTREEVKEVELAVGEGGFVKGAVTYMVMDDLVVTPMSTASGITLLSKFNVEEGLTLLKASLQSKTVLTSVFLGNTGAED
ncbi:hypothetical protein RHSIM_Rhsim09G0159900 [Rhododendron simsii]|uniref:DUF674 domain-containing protein n=1 Tax=Rhododendron simsii TaxID=118357 RepID=A0A834GII7_RHOSS|nr:hypothetical protein RHSIM_Rhsim09G0159900 [Rhododendron simsii]